MKNCTSSRWTTLEDQLLKDLQFTHTHKQISELIGRSTNAVRGRYYTLGITCKNPSITEYEKDTIQNWYLSHEDTYLDEFNLDELAARLGRSKQLISRIARKMGLTKPSRGMSPERKTYTGNYTKKSIAENGHPKGMLGKKQSDDFKKKMSERVKEQWVNMTPLEYEVIAMKRNATLIEKYGTTNTALNQSNPYSRTKSGKRADLDNIFFRSAWEANYARYLNFLIKQGEIDKWEFEPQTFIFHGEYRGSTSYLPDFKVYNSDGTYEWHEVKGWMDAKSKSKLKKMAKFYPDEKVVLVGKDEYKAIAKWKALIEGWE
mgnify:CR=1 FL=1